MTFTMISVRAQGVDFRGAQANDIQEGQGAALSQGLGGASDDVDGLRSPLDDSAVRVRRYSLIEGDGRPGDGDGARDGDDGDASAGDERDRRDPRDRSFRGEIDDPRRERILDGDLRAQDDAARRRIEPVRDGDFGVVILDDDDVRDGARGDEFVQGGVIRDQDALLEATRSRGATLDDDVRGGRDFVAGRRARRGRRRDFPRSGGGGNEPNDFLEDDLSDGVDDGVGGRANPALARDRTPSPYEPLGVRVGSFRLFPEAIVSGVFTDNVREASGPKDSDVALEVRPSIRARSQWSRHSLEADLEGTRSYYKKFDSEDEREFLSNLRGRIDIIRRTNIEGEAGYSLSQQSRGTADAPTGAVDNPDVHVRRLAAALNHRFNRLSLRLRGEVTDETYDNARLVNGGESDEGDQDNREQALTLRGTYELNPGLSVFGSGEVERRDFDQVSNSDGISRDQDGFGLRAGILFDNGSKLYGEMAFGLVHVSADDGRLSDVDGVTFDADITWRPSELTTVSLAASTDIDATTVTGSLAALTRTADLRFSHELMRHFILNGGIGLDFIDYKGSTLVEVTYRAQLGAEYIFNRETALIAVYDYAAFRSGTPNSDYESNQVRLGVRIRR